VALENLMREKQEAIEATKRAEKEE